MAPNNRLDPAVISLLKLDPDHTTVTSHGRGGGTASTAKITTILADGSEMNYFMKTGCGAAAQTMFEGEHLSLTAIHSAAPTLCTKSFGWGVFANPPSPSSSQTQAFLVTEFLDHSARNTSDTRGTTLAQKLAQLHTTPAPVPAGHSTPQFGFAVPTCCGETPQDNTFTPSWATFYADSRLRFIRRRAERANGADAPLAELVETTCTRVVPRLLGDGHLLNGGGRGVTPVVVHGDLWSGNAGVGRLPGRTEEEVEEYVFDSSACYAHSEYELGIMRMFGGFDAAFWREYHELVPKAEPVEEYEDRIKLYELYHQLNHHAMFGHGYRNTAAGIMKALIAKYGDNDTSDAGRRTKGGL